MRSLWNEEEREAALMRRKLPLTTSMEKLLEYEYRRGLQVAVLVDDPVEIKKIASRIKARKDGEVSR